VATAGADDAGCPAHHSPELAFIWLWPQFAADIERSEARFDPRTG